MKKRSEKWPQPHHYTGEKETPRRPGSMVAFELPHLINGKRVARKRPSLISMRGER